MPQRKRPPTVDPVFSFCPSLHLSCSILCLLVSPVTFTKWLLSWTLCLWSSSLWGRNHREQGTSLKGRFIRRMAFAQFLVVHQLTFFFLSPPCSHATRTKRGPIEPWLVPLQLSVSECHLGYLTCVCLHHLVWQKVQEISCQQYISFGTRVLKHVLGHVSLIPMPT